MYNIMKTSWTPWYMFSKTKCYISWRQKPNIVKICIQIIKNIVTMFVSGYCTEYNEVGTVIQEHYNRKCADVTPPCASTYLSTESYLCKNLCFQTFNPSLYAENRCLIYSTACTFPHVYSSASLTCLSSTK